MRSHIVFYLNGVRHEVGGAHAGWMLADYLRQERALTGTKVVCAEGDCGACTVLRYFPRASEGTARFLPVNACIATVAQMDGSSIVTVDALSEAGESPAGFTPVQKAMMECHGSQCGFCTPGFVMALTGLVEKRLCGENKAPIGAQEAKNALTGNLCRCTGYQPIIDAAVGVPVRQCQPLRERFWSAAQEKDLQKALATAVAFKADGFSFFAPRTLKEVSAYLRRHRDARLLAAGTDAGVVHNKRKARLAHAVSLHLVKELYAVKAVGKGRLRVGARVTLSELRRAVKGPIPELARFLDLFASPQIKNVATLAGNVGNASPIADMPPFLLAADAVVHLYGAGARRTVPLDRFYLGYRKTALRRGELIAAIEFDVPGAQEKLALYKASQRRDLDISAVNAAFRAQWGDGRRLKGIRIALGGMAATPLRLKKTEAALLAGPIDETALDRAVEVFHGEMEPLSDLRGSGAYRRVVSESLLRRFFRENGP